MDASDTTTPSVTGGNAEGQDGLNALVVPPETSTIGDIVLKDPYHKTMQGLGACPGMKMQSAQGIMLMSGFSEYIVREKEELKRENAKCRETINDLQDRITDLHKEIANRDTSIGRMEERLGSNWKIENLKNIAMVFGTLIGKYSIDFFKVDDYITGVPLLLTGLFLIVTGWLPIWKRGVK